MKMREVWMWDVHQGEETWRVRFSVWDGDTQIDVDKFAVNKDELTKARAEAETEIRAEMARLDIDENSLTEFPRGILPPTDRPPFAD